MNTDKTAIRQSIEIALSRRLGARLTTVRNTKGKPTAEALREQAAFIAGAAAALQAVFGDPKADLLTDYVPPSWIISAIRNELI